MYTTIATGAPPTTAANTTIGVLCRTSDRVCHVATIESGHAVVLVDRYNSRCGCHFEQP